MFAEWASGKYSKTIQTASYVSDYQKLMDAQSDHLLNPFLILKVEEYKYT